MRRPRRPAAAGGGRGTKARLQTEVAAGVKDAEGAPVIAVGLKDEEPVLGVSVVAAARVGGGDKVTHGAGVAVGVQNTEGVPVIVSDGKDGVPVRGVPVIAAVDGKGYGPAVEGVPAASVKRSDKVETDEEGVTWVKHYSSMQSILIVGDGDFSFSLALATAFGSGENLVATSLDSYEDLTKKYSKAKVNVMELKRMGATVLHGVNAKIMRRHSYLKMRRFDRIVFNFPHAGFKGKEGQVRVINSHKELVRGFFGNAVRLLQPYGETHLSHKRGPPYDAWDIKQLASESSLIIVDEVDFHKKDYPGYNQKRGDSAKCDQPFALGPCCTFKFCIGDVKKLKKERGNCRIDSISSFGGSNVYPGTLATDCRPFAPLPLVPSLSWPHFHPGNTGLEPYPNGVTQRENQYFPANCYGTERAPYFHHQHTIQPMFDLLRPPLNVLPTECGIPPMRRITSMPFSAPPEHHWYQERPNVELLPRGNCSKITWEHQRRLLMEYENQRRVMPGGTNLGYSTFLEDRYRKSVEKREHLESLIAQYRRLKDRSEACHVSPTRIARAEEPLTFQDDSTYD